MMDPQILARVQPLPPATRRRLVAALAEGRAFDFRDDDLFYAWLMERYGTLGLEAVDRELTAGGRNDARRSLRAMAGQMAVLYRREVDAEKLDLHSPEADRGAARLRSVAIADIDAVTDWIRSLDDDRGPSGCETATGFDPIVITRARALLDRIEGCFEESVAAGLLDWVTAAETVFEKIDAINRDNEERALALSSYQAAVAELPSDVQARLAPTVEPEGDASDLERAAVALRAVTEHWRAKERADAEYFANRVSEHRQQALERLVAAAAALEDAEAAARAQLPASATTLPSTAEDLPVEEAAASEPRPLAQRADAVRDAEDELIEARTALADLPRVDKANEEDEPRVSDHGDATTDVVESLPPDAGDPEIDPGTGHDPDEATCADEPESVVPSVLPAEEEEPEEIRPAEPEPSCSVSWDRWVDMALAAERPALAAHLARAREFAGADDDRSWPSIVLEALVVGCGVTLGNDRATQRYERLAPQLLDLVAEIECTSDRDFGVVMALIAGALRPSLMASYAASTVLEQTRLVGPLQGLHRLVDFAKEGPQLRLSAITDLAAPLEQSERLRRRNQAVAALSAWCDGERARTFPYQPATALWRDMLAKQGMIGAVVEAIVTDEPSAAVVAEGLARRLRDDPDDVLDRAFDENLKTPGARRMTGMARKAFLTKLNETSDLIEAWQLVADTPKDRGDRLERHRERLAAAIVAARPVVDAATGPTSHFGAGLLTLVLDQLNAVLRADALAPHDGERRFSDEIALLADFPINGRGRFELHADDVVPLQRAAEINLVAGVPDAGAAMERALEIGATGTARALAEQIGATPEVHHRIDAREVVERRDLDARRQALRALLDDLQSASTGSDRTLNELEAILAGIEELDLAELPRAVFDAESVGDFPVLRQRLDTLAAQLQTKRAGVAQEFANAIAELERDYGELGDCRALLTSGDLGTLAEDLSQIRQFGPDRVSTKPRNLLAGLKSFATDVLAAEPLTMPAVLRAIADAQPLEPFDFSHLPAAERVDAETLARAWVALKEATATGSVSRQEAALRDILAGLGFSGVKISKNVAWRAGRRFDIRVDPLRSADDCIVPAFGSEAQGAYSILVMGRGALERSLVGLDDLPSGVIAFATEWLPPKTRREFLKRSRARPAATALLDDAGVIALAATSGRTLRTFFNLAIPFGAARPYADTAAATSVEMFFGREEEYRQLVDPQGSSLVYGGRQLGKTALLKQVELRNRANPDFVVVYLDIKNVGSSVPPELIWDRISEALSNSPVVAGERRAPGRIEDVMVTWLSANPQRRILILLDEADNFLEAEMEGDFINIVRIKSLMEETNRRLKLVFAGLHNVQRFVRTPNSPLLHFGEPVNIGPLLGPDRDAARRMVFEPMAAVGVGFERASDAHHMLSLVGYYPSLLQTLGKSLLATVDRQLARAAEPEQLPILLDRATIVSTFTTSSFRDELLSKFRKTLELDPRYELITYAVCLRADEDRSSGRITGQGYTARDIFELAFDWWPQGFEGIRSADLFSALLDEMVGLGVLARQGDRFALRSARIAAMLGRRDQIENHLLHFSTRKVERKADPLSNHRAVEGGHSPMSLRQERMLVDQLRADKPVAVVFFDGLDAAVSRDALANSIVSLAKLQNWPEPRMFEFRDMDGLRAVVTQAKKDAREGRPLLIVCRGALPSEADLKAVDTLRELRDRLAPVRLLFLGRDDHDIAADACRRFQALRSAAISIGPWDGEAIHHWLERHLDHPDRTTEIVDLVMGLTGGFSAVFDAIKTPRHRIGREELLRHLEQAAARSLDARALGLGDPGMFSLATALAEWNDEADDEVLKDLAATALGERGEQFVERAKRVGIVESRTTAGERRWTLNPAVARIARSAR